MPSDSEISRAFLRYGWSFTSLAILVYRIIRTSHRKTASGRSIRHWKGVEYCSDHARSASQSTDIEVFISPCLALRERVLYNLLEIYYKSVVRVIRTRFKLPCSNSSVSWVGDQEKPYALECCTSAVLSRVSLKAVFHAEVVRSCYIANFLKYRIIKECHINTLFSS